jgi:hypothetical protein
MDSDLLELKLAGTVPNIGVALKLATLMKECTPKSIEGEIIQTDNAVIVKGTHKPSGIATIAFMALATDGDIDVPVYTISPAIANLVIQIGVEQGEAIKNAGRMASDAIAKAKASATKH